MTEVLAPVAGRVVGLAGVPDLIFAKAMMGPGTAIDPIREPGTAVAPLAGRLVKLQSHAYVLVDAERHAILVHLGIDTVELRGEGFEMLAAEGHDVMAGRPLVRWNPADVEAGGRSPICPVVALDATDEALKGVLESGRVAMGDPLFIWT